MFGHATKRPKKLESLLQNGQNLSSKSSEWQLQQTGQWMNQAQRSRPRFWVYLQRDGQVTEPMMALRLYGYLLTLEFLWKSVSSRLKKRWEQTPEQKQAGVLELPVVRNLHLVYSNGESRRVGGYWGRIVILYEKSWKWGNVRNTNQVRCFPQSKIRVVERYWRS